MPRGHCGGCRGPRLPAPGRRPKRQGDGLVFASETAVVSMINPFSGAGVSSGPSNPAFDFSGLATYYAAGAQLSPKL